MPRGKIKRVQCQDEYMTEEHIGQESFPQQQATPSENQTTSTNIDKGFMDSDDDIDCNVQAENGEKGRRGKTKLKDVWNLPKGTRIVVACNELNQAIGPEAGLLGKFLGMVARNGCLCSLSYSDWRKLIGHKERNSNEEKNKKDILDQVKMRFLYNSHMEKFILKSIGEKWRQHKSNLKSLYFDEHNSKEFNYNNVPVGVVADQWNALVNNWMSKKAQEISEQNRNNCANKRSKHTAGSKSFARNREELRLKDPEKKNPRRAVLYIHTHQPKSDKDMNGHVGDLKTLLEEQPNLADTTCGKTAWKGDALNQILGDDKPGHLHGLGLVPNPKQVLDLSTSSRFKNMKLTSMEQAQSEELLSFRLEMQEVKDKIADLERKQKNQESIELALSSRDDPYADGQNSKRKRVYGGHCSSQTFGVVDQENDIQNGNFEPLKKRSAVDKQYIDDLEEIAEKQRRSKKL